MLTQLLLEAAHGEWRAPCSRGWKQAGRRWHWLIFTLLLSLSLRENEEANSEAGVTAVLPTLLVTLVLGTVVAACSTCFSQRRQQETGRLAGSLCGVEPACVL